jgi:hypothetical protein
MHREVSADRQQRARQFSGHRLVQCPAPLDAAGFKCFYKTISVSVSPGAKYQLVAVILSTVLKTLQ